MFSSILSANLLFKELSDGFSILITLGLLVSFLAVDFVDDAFLISHFSHHAVSTFECFNQKVNSLIELVEIHLHVFFLTFEILWLLITIEIFKLVFIFNIGIVSILRLLNRCGTLDLAVILILLLVFDDSGVGVLLKHESVSSFQGSSLDVLCSLWEEITELLQDIFGNTHENDVRQLLWCSCGIWSMSESLENKVRFQVVEDLVVTKVRVFRQVQDWLLLLNLIVLIVEDFNKSLSDEVHLLDIAFVTNDHFTWCVDPAVHANDELVGKSSFTFFEEMVE